MNSDAGTKTQQISSGCTDTTRPSTYMRGLSLTKSSANKLLDSRKEGQSYPRHLINLALIATGDMKGVDNEQIIL